MPGACPFIAHHPDLFVIFLSILLLAYLTFYGAYCLFLYVIDAVNTYNKHHGTGTVCCQEISILGQMINGV